MKQPGPFRQSLAKVLLTKSPAHCLATMEGERRAGSKVMRRGTLVDQLIYGKHNYHVVQGVYKSGPRKGHQWEDWTSPDARQMVEDMAAKGITACLGNELEAAHAIAGRVRSVLLTAGFDPKTFNVQTPLAWTAPNGIDCVGEPDVWVNNGTSCPTIDTKCGDNGSPEWLADHVRNQYWHLQGAAYQQALQTITKRSWLPEHWILVAEPEAPYAVTFEPLSEEYMQQGRELWALALDRFKTCCERNEWPEYQRGAISPSQRARFAHNKDMGRNDF